MKSARDDWQMDSFVCCETSPEDVVTCIMWGNQDRYSVEFRLAVPKGFRLQPLGYMPRGAYSMPDLITRLSRVLGMEPGKITPTICARMLLIEHIASIGSSSVRHPPHSCSADSGRGPDVTPGPVTIGKYTFEHVSGRQPSKAILAELERAIRRQDAWERWFKRLYLGWILTAYRWVTWRVFVSKHSDRLRPVLAEAIRWLDERVLDERLKAARWRRYSGREKR